MHNSPILAGKWAILKKITATEKNPKTVWRREVNSNSRLLYVSEVNHPAVPQRK